MIAVWRIQSADHPPYWLERCPSFCSRWSSAVWSLLPSGVEDGKDCELYGDVRAGTWDADDTFCLAVPHLQEGFLPAWTSAARVPRAAKTNVRCIP